MSKPRRRLSHRAAPPGIINSNFLTSGHGLAPAPLPTFLSDDLRQSLPTETDSTGFLYGILRQKKISSDSKSVRWWWFVNVKRQGQDIARNFYDQTLGGAQEALTVAIAWRDAALRLIPPVTKRQVQIRPRSTNTSGVPGVSLVRKNGQPVGWKASLVTPKRTYQKTFSTKTHGDERAKKLAIAERQRLLEQYGSDAFVTLNAQATQEAEQHFGHLLDAPSQATPVLPAQVSERINALNQWFDQLHPEQLYVHVKVYPVAKRNSTIVFTRISSPGMQNRVVTKGLSLAHVSYQQCLPEVWHFIETTLTAWYGSQRWQGFAERQQRAFMTSDAQSGFQAREYSTPPGYPECLAPPAALLPMLADFELPDLPYLQVKAQVAPLQNDKSNAAIMPATVRPRSKATSAQIRDKAKEQPMSRTFIAHSALGDQLQFRSMTGREQMGYLFEFQVNLISETQGISAKALLGTDLTVEVDLTTEANGAGKRYLSGQVTAFTFAGKDGDYFAYTATLRPWLWLASRRKDFKIFQNMTVPDIVQDVLSKYGFGIDNKLCKAYRSWEYCTQYDESDFSFVSRLLEHEGINYYFAHQMGSHSLVLADDIGSHSPLPNGPTTISYYPETRAAHIHDQDFMDDLAGYEDIASGRYAADDYDFKKPKALLDTKQANPAGHSQDNWEVFHWPGGYTEVGDGEKYANARMDQIRAERETVTIQGNARNIAPGYLFNLDKYPVSTYNKQYLIESASYSFTENVQRSDGAGSSGRQKRVGEDTPTTYRIGLTAVTPNGSYRVQHHTHKPRTTGPQTAVVVGPPGEEIWTDQYGRVKVQFHWDRYGKNDENSSCWIRVSSPWAGGNYGGIFIPRIGHEVIVDFINGDPDYPIITGRVYNAMMMPPWELPANKTQSGVKTRSSKNGQPGAGMKNGPGAANAIRFEDMAGAEQLWLHAQKDQLTEVEHDEDKWVGQDRRKVIDRDEFNTIHRDRTEVVDRNEKINVHGWRTEEVDLDETITIHGNRTEEVDKNEKITIHQNRTERVDHNEKISIGDNRTEDVGKNEKVSIGINQNLKVGSNKQETIGLTSLKNVGIAQMTNIGAVYNLNVGAAWITNVGFMNYETIGKIKKVTVGDSTTFESGKTTTITAGESITITAGKNIILQSGGAKITLDGENNTITVEAKEIKVDGTTIVDVNSEKIDLN